jgi:hypothetical protein
MPLRVGPSIMRVRVLSLIRKILPWLERESVPLPVSQQYI